jgi:transcriptional regulator with XRE-family HTH domain
MRTNLKVFRTAHKLRQTDIAYELGVSRATYSFIERGIRSGSGEFWQTLQRVYNVPDEQMYTLMKLDEERTEQCETNEK